MCLLQPSLLGLPKRLEVPEVSRVRHLGRETRKAGWRVGERMVVAIVTFGMIHDMDSGSIKFAWNSKQPVFDGNLVKQPFPM